MGRGAVGEPLACHLGQCRIGACRRRYGIAFGQSRLVFIGEEQTAPGFAHVPLEVLIVATALAALAVCQNEAQRIDNRRACIETDGHAPALQCGDKSDESVDRRFSRSGTLPQHPSSGTAVNRSLTTSQSSPILGRNALLALVKWLENRHQAGASGGLEPATGNATRTPDHAVERAGATPAQCAPSGAGGRR